MWIFLNNSNTLKVLLNTQIKLTREAGSVYHPQKKTKKKKKTKK